MVGSTESRVPRAGVVIVTRNRSGRLEAALRSLAGQTAGRAEFEVVVVDDASGDETGEVLERLAGELPIEIRALPVGERPGLGALRNLGWRESSAGLIAFTDDDCELDPGWIEALLEAADGAPGAFIQGRTEPIERELTQLHPLARTKRIGEAGPWFQTCNIAYPRELLERLGGFDEGFDVAGEDTDLGWRALEAGSPVAFAPEALARHAVEPIGVGGWLEIARRERVLTPLFGRHPGLREQVARGLVFKGHHALFALALAGLIVSPRRRPALLAALPYVRLAAARARADRGGLAWIAWYPLYDAVAIAYSLRGAIENRVPLV